MSLLKDLMVPITGTSGDEDAIGMAVGLARAYRSHLCAWEIVHLPMPIAGPWGMVPDLAIDGLYNELRLQGKNDAERLKIRLAKESVSTEVKLVESLFTDPALTAAYHAQYADLTIVAASAGDTAEAATTRNFVGALLMESGRPVLMVPAGCKATVPPQRIVVGWRPAREAARALHDALSLLVDAETVELVLVDPSDREPEAGIASHLLRHGVEVDVVERASEGRSIESILLERARETDAQLLVVGGYGHSRAHEWALGGVTRGLIKNATIPVFFSH